MKHRQLGVWDGSRGWLVDTNILLHSLFIYERADMANVNLLVTDEKQIHKYTQFSIQF